MRISAAGDLQRSLQMARLRYPEERGSPPMAWPWARGRAGEPPPDVQSSTLLSQVLTDPLVKAEAMTPVSREVRKGEAHF